MSFKTVTATIGLSLVTLASPLGAHAEMTKPEALNARETVAEMNARLLEDILQSASSMSRHDAKALPADETVYFPVREQIIEFDITGPVTFSIMEELLLQRFENNINDRGQSVAGQAVGQSRDSSSYIRSTIAAAELSLPF